MKKVFFIICVLSFFSSCQKTHQEKPGNGDTPSITIVTEDNLTVPAEGGEVSIHYELLNPAEGGRIEAASEPEWIDGFNYDIENEVSFTVSANETGQARETRITLTYIYDEGQKVTDGISILQPASEPTSIYDYEYSFSDFTGWYYGANGNNGECNYYTRIYFPDNNQQDGKGEIFYLFNIYAPASEDPHNAVLPAGTYSLGESGHTDEWTFTREFSKYSELDENNTTAVFTTGFTEGTLEVSHEGDTMTIDALLTDIYGNSHHATYTGKPVYWYSEPEGLPEITEDITFEAVLGKALYQDGRGTDVMTVSMQFSDAETNDNGELVPPGTILTVQAYIPYNEDGSLPTGHFTMSENGEVMTIYPTIDTGIFGLFGSYAEYLPTADASQILYGIFVDGTMDISHDSDNYTINVSLYNAAGNKVTTSYTGSITVQNVPEKGISTLEGDYTLDLEGATGRARYFGEYNETGGANWKLFITPTSGPDRLEIDLVAEGVDFTAGIPTGVYTAASDNDALPGQYMPGGMISPSVYWGTMYLGGFVGSTATQYAPAISGNLEITNNGDGTYKIWFSFKDDIGNTWDGEWSGAMDLEDTTV